MSGSRALAEVIVKCKYRDFDVVYVILLYVIQFKMQYFSF